MYFISATLTAKPSAAFHEIWIQTPWLYLCAVGSCNYSVSHPVCLLHQNKCCRSDILFAFVSMKPGIQPVFKCKSSYILVLFPYFIILSSIVCMVFFPY